LSKTAVQTLTDFFRPQAPLWACELTSTHAIVAGVNSKRKKIADKFAADLPAGVLSSEDADGKPALTVPLLGPIVRQLLGQVGFKGSEIAVVVPDDTARIAFLTAENPSKNAEEQRTFIRWKLKKSVPFDVDTAQVAYRIMGPHRNGSGVDILVALSPRSRIAEYEALFESLDIQAGIVLPSTLAALNLLTPPPVDALFLKVAPDCVTTTILQNGRIQFYRRVVGVSLYDAVYPTVLYYQDKLGGSALKALYVCGYDTDLQALLAEVEEKLGLRAQRLEPRGIDDLYKPALGAIHLKPETAL
jgi:hypothetical protein